MRSNGHAAFGSLWLLWLLIEEVRVSAAVIRPNRELSCDSTDRQPADGKDRHQSGRHEANTSVLCGPFQASLTGRDAFVDAEGATR